MNFESLLPIWSKLTPSQQERIKTSVVPRTLGKGAVLHNGSVDCAGLVLIRSGQLRAYILSECKLIITFYTRL